MPTFDPVLYKQTTHQQWQEAAEAWHRWGPTLESWLGEATGIMLDMARLRPGDRVLDVAAGAGGQTLAAARRVGPHGHVLATDLSEEILKFAHQESRRHGLGHVETRVMDGEDLQLEPESFDAVLSRVGLIYFPDRQRALQGMRRVLKPGGRLAAIVYSTPESNRFFSTPVSIIRRRAELGPPLPGQPGPFSLGSPGVLEEALVAAGFRDVEIHTVSAPLRMRSVQECVRFERESFGALHQMLSGLPDEGRAAAWDEIARELAAFDGPQGFAAPCELLVASGAR